MSGFSRFLTGLRNLILGLGLLAAAGYVGWQYFNFWRAGVQYPPGTMVAEVAVGGMDREEAAAAIAAVYDAPVIVLHRDSRVDIDPVDAGFQLDSDAMLAVLEQEMAQQTTLERFAAYLLRRPLAPITVPLSATHDPAQLDMLVTSIADYLDRPATNAQFIPVSLTLRPGEPGYSTDLEASIPLVANALYDPDQRLVNLLVVDQPAGSADISALETFIRGQLETFSGGGSFFILNLDTGEEVFINADKAMSGTSTVKIAIVLESLRATDGVSFDQQKLISETLTLSGNYSANLLLDVVAGQDNAYLGSDILTQSLWSLGLTNTFIATPYEEPPRPDRPTYATPANSGASADIIIDDAMQTTAEDIGTLLSMVYYCSQGGGALLELYPGQLTPEECDLLLFYLSNNRDGLWLFGEGLPQTDDVFFAHKHGWINGDVGLYGTHGDAALVRSPGANFVIAGYLYDVGWLDWQVTGPLMRTIARATYNYFNPDAPFVVAETSGG